jgi:hypothetical protein
VVQFNLLLLLLITAQVMECAAGGSLTSYVADKWQKAQAMGLFLSEDEARYFFKASSGRAADCSYGQQWVVSNGILGSW